MSMFFLRHQKSADAAMAVACRRREQAGADHAREHLRLRELEPGGACPGRAASAWWSRRATAPRARRWPSSGPGPPTSARSSARPAAWPRAAATPRSWASATSSRTPPPGTSSSSWSSSAPACGACSGRRRGRACAGGVRRGARRRVRQGRGGARRRGGLGGGARRARGLRARSRVHGRPARVRQEEEGVTRGATQSVRERGRKRR